MVAILAADVVGYSRLMGADEEGTLSTLNAHLAEFIESLIADHKGRIVKKMGDGLLVEFASVVDAVHCAVAWQEGMAVRNADADQNGNIVFRIGINIGDVIVQDDDVFGDGVNVAARLEGLAEPGGICISRSARDQIPDKLEYGLEDLGEVAVKNIARPVRVFRVLPKGVVVSTSVKPPAGKRRWAPIGGAGLALLLIGALIWWQPWQGYIDQPAPGSGQSAKTEKPSIAVMPFANRSNDSAQAYFSSGITEDITTDLSKVTGLFITPGSATRRYRGQEIDPRVIGRKLGVRYILEGGVRRADKHLRITARLIDTSTGIQVWAERYDRELKDIFSIQDDIADRVVSALSEKLSAGPLRRVARVYTPNSDAYDYYIHGRANRIPPTPTNLAAALSLFEKAIERDPKFAGGFAGAAYVHILRYGNPFPPGKSPSAELETALRLAQKAVKLDPSFGPGWGSLSEAYMRKGLFEDALKAQKKAMELSPNDSLMRAAYGRLLGHIGRAEEGIKYVKQATRMSPDSLPMLYFLGSNYRAAGQFDAAIKALVEHRKRLGGRVVAPPTSQLIAAYVQAGQLDKARAEVAGLIRVSPRFTVAVAQRTHVYKSEAQMVLYVSALRKAGLPD